MPKSNTKNEPKGSKKIVRIPAKFQICRVMPNPGKHTAVIEFRKKDMDAILRSTNLALAELGLTFDALVGYDYELRRNHD